MSPVRPPGVCYPFRCLCAAPDSERTARGSRQRVGQGCPVKASGGVSKSLPKKEAAVLTSFKRGPWAGAAHHGRVKASRLEYFGWATSAEPLFQELYPFMCRCYYRNNMPPEYGSDAHVSFMFEKAKKARVVTHTGCKVKRSRWFNLETQLSLMLPELGFLLLVLLRIGLFLGWYEGISQCPLFKDLPPPDFKDFDDDAEPPGEEGPGEEPAGEEDDDELPPEDEPLKKLTAMTLHTVTEMISNRQSLAAYSCIDVVVGPIKKAHGFLNVDCRTIFAGSKWMVDMAHDGWVETVDELCLLLCTRSSILAVGLTSTDRQLNRLDVEFAEEMALADAFFDLFAHATGGWIIDMMEHSHTLPKLFAGLLTRDEEKLNKCRQRLKEFHDTFRGLQLVGNTCAEAKAHLRFIPWCKAPWVWELLVGFYECDFMTLPRPALQEVMAMSQAWITSLPVELAANRLRKVQRQHPASKLGRTSRWHKVANSDILKDMDRSPVSLTEADTASVRGVRGVTSNLFDAQRHDLSLGEEFCEAVVNGDMDFAIPKAELVYERTLCCNALRICRARGLVLSKCWYSVLAAPKVVISTCVEKEWTAGLLVCRSSEHGVIGITVAVEKSEGGKLFMSTRRAEGLERWDHVIIEDPTAWRAVNVVAVPPSCHVEMIGLAVPRDEVLLVAQRQPEGLHVASARGGFSGASRPRLLQLKTLMGVEGKAPKSNFGLLTMLVAFCLPGKTPEQIEAIVRERGVAPPAKFVSLITAKNVKDAGECIDEDVMQDVRARVTSDAVKKQVKGAVAKERKRAREDVKKKPPTEPPAHSTVSPSTLSSGSSKTRCPLVVKEQYTKDDVRAVCPPEPKIVIKRDPIAGRWQLNYPTGRAPYSTSKAWGDLAHERACVLHCVEWAWDQHRRLHPTVEVPYTFEV